VYSAPAATERYSDVVVSGVNAEDVIYDPPFLGGVQTNVEAKLAQTVSVKDFGAVGDGVTDDTAAIQDALNYSKYVEAPEGTYRLDGYIEIPANTALVLKNANLQRLSSQSSSTDPLVYVGNSGAKLIGFGNPAVSSENNSPLGVVAVFPRLLDRNVFRPGVSGIRIIGNSDASSICLRVRSGASESATGVTYFGSYRDLDLSYAGTLLYLGPQANAHMFENVLGAHFSGPMIDLVGLPGVDDRCYANGFVNFWSTNALPGGTNQPMVRGRHALNNFGINMFGEHGGTLPRWLDFDATCSNNSFFGSSNLSGGSAIAAGSRTAAIPTGNIHADIISWTPTIIGETVAGSHTYFSQIGSIMRVGRLVQVSFSIAVNSWDAACDGNLLIAGLPVEIATGQDASLNVSDWAGFTLPAGYSALNLLGRVGTNQIRVRRVGQLVSPANVTAAERTGGLTTIISGSGTFITTALY
jgi:hypothetical protein